MLSRNLLPLALVLVASATGCAAASADASSDGEGARIGHGSASRPDLDLSSGDRNNPFDTTDDPTDPEFVPSASSLLPRADSKDEVATTSSALSTTTGTTFEFTYYWIAQRPAGDLSQVTIRDCAGTVINKVSYDFRDDINMEGTARFLDMNGNSVTVNTGNGCLIRLPYSQRWGLGVTNPATGKSFELRPFRSIAVDTSILTLGKWYYVKQLDGVKMPYPASTMIHDGCVRAMDVGWGISGRHIDFYAGYKSAYSTLVSGSSTMGGRESVTVYDGREKCALHIERGY
jgi:3D (Asp-Asp-Asp) domain-containing protein